MLSPCPSVCLSVNQFSREPWDTQNQYFQHRSVYTSPGINPNLVCFWQLSSELHGKTMCIIIYSTAYSTAVLRVACSHTHTLAYGSDVNELGHTVWSRGCQHLATVTRRAGYYISVAHSLQVTRIIFIATSIAVITLNENNLRHRLI